MRPGQAAALQASRRREAEEAADAARARLDAYWSRHRRAAGAGLPARWMDRRYYEQAERDARELDRQRNKERNLEDRRNKLAMMLFHEDMQQKEELKIHQMHVKMHKPRSYLDTVPTSTLREVNLGFKVKEEERRRQEAEIMLYHQWRASQPAIRECESRQRHGALKSAWMEQVIEKETNRKKEKEETEKILQERDRCLKRQMEREKEAVLVKEQRMKDLQEQLCKQISDLRESEKSANLLRRQEEAESSLLEALRAAGDLRREGATKRVAARTVTLSNMAMQARRLKERAREAEKDVEADLRELAAIAVAIEKDTQRQESSRMEWKVALESAVESLEKQRELERNRQKHLEGIMDGEARVIFAKQEKKWQEEHSARQALLDDILSTLDSQVKAKLEECRKKQQENIMNRELMLVQIERANSEMEQAEKLKEKSQTELSKITSLQIEMKQLEREEKENCEKKQRAMSLREAAREEEKLRSEIIRLQKEGSAFQMHRRRRFLL